MKKKIIDFDAPVTTVFSLISILLFLLDYFVFKGSMTQTFLASPTTANGSAPFSFSKAESYFRMIFYAFGAISWEVLITNLLFVLLLGPAMEEKYGSVVIGIMMFVSSLFSGVLASCFCKTSLQGCASIIFMMIFLNSFISFSKKKLPFSFVIIFILFIVREIIVKNTNGFLGMIVVIAGGLCGSLFAFLASPKAKAARKTDSGEGFLSKAERLVEKENKKTKVKKNNRHDDEDDDGTTVIGTFNI